MSPRQRKPSKYPWKQNFNRLPPELLAKARKFRGPFVVATPARISLDDIEAGLFEHMGITWIDDGLVFGRQVLPDPKVGRWSATNMYGREVVRKDLPMVSRTYDMETPNYGDWSRGSHTVSHTRQVYQRELIPAKQLSIRVDLIGEETGRRRFAFQFTVDEVLNPSADGSEDALFFALNLLQENVGRSDVFSTEARLEDYLGSLYVNWELLPPGERESNISVILTKVRDLSDRQKLELVDRYDLLATLRPSSFVLGTNGFRHYFGAIFEDDLVVFENIEYGNAVYVMGENWRTLSRLSRTELLARAQRDFLRIPHAGSWKKRLRAEVRSRRRKRAS
ncbi:MAG: hypothetical protein WEC75_10210 [Dehalococcoidia bacterium]